jgi:hypothetical protein
MIDKSRKKRKFLFVDMYPHSLAYKLLYILKDYFEVTLIILQDKMTSNHLLEDYKSLGIKIYYFDVNKKKKDLFKFIFRLLIERMKGYDFVLGKSGPNWFTYLIFKIFNSSKKVFFPLDIFLFLWKNQDIRPKLGVMFEKSNLKNADFIINKNIIDQIKLIRKDEIDRIDGKIIHFIPCLDDWIVPINKNKPKKLSLVYVGVCPDDALLLRITWTDYFKKISSQGIDQHIYALKAVKIQEFSKVDKPNIFYHEPLPNKILNKEISKYHYGIVLSFLDKKAIDERFLKVAFGNKVLCYLEAGIPIITDDETVTADFVRKYNCGVVISEKDLSNLKEILKKQNYPELLKGVNKAREEFRVSKRSKKLIEELNS